MFRSRMVQLVLAASLLASEFIGHSPAAPARSFEEAIDRAVTNERLLIRRLRDKEPVIETYIQETKTDSDLGFVPSKDYYFLGRLNMREGIVDDSYLPTPPKWKEIPHIFTALLTTKYYPGGFADEMFLDVDDFDRAHYSFEYVRREFLGDVRCLVVDAAPLKEAGGRGFVGRIWIEDRDYNIVRFNGSYTPSPSHEFAHFDSWRVNTGGLWLPSYIYAQDEGYRFGPVHTPPMRAQTRLWDYERAGEKADQAFTNLTVDIPQGVKDDSDASAENSPVQSYRMWEEQAADNVIDRLERAGLLAPPGEVDRVLDTVLNNLEVTNNIAVDPAVHARVLLTTPLESEALNHTILISRGLIDVLPDEACLAAVLAHELAHIVLGHSVNTKYAFEDRLLFDDPATLKRIALRRTQQEEQAADERALEILKKSPYKANLPKVGLFLRMLSARSSDVPHLIRPLLGNRMANTHKDLRLAGLMDVSPELKIRDKDQISALPLGSRIRMDPWSDQLHLMKTMNVVLLTAKEKMPFQVTPFMLHLTREEKRSPARPAANHAN
ncbi:MAG TPA: M48 family metalloprotease [Bryobacteraceae bacterium]